MERKFKVGHTIYQRSHKYGVGKEIGGKIYVHKKYADKVINQHDLLKAASLLPKGFNYNCIMVDRNEPYVIRFDEASGFDTEREPTVGSFVKVYFNEFVILKGYSNYIWHHKWMWVDDDYDGFDVEEAYQWSKTWTQHITHPSGSKKVWLEQIKEIEQ